MKTAKTDGTIIEFLKGTHSFEGVWFGDRHPTRIGVFWWRDLLQSYASHPSPVMSTAEGRRESYNKGYKHGVAAATPVMSAEQVEYGYYYPLFKFFSDEHGLTLLDSQLQDVIHECKKFIEPTSPSVKADRWVRVEEIRNMRNLLPDNWKWHKCYELPYVNSRTGREFRLKHWALTAPDGKGLVCSLGLISHDHNSENHKKFLENDAPVEWVEKSLLIVDSLLAEIDRLRGSVNPLPAPPNVNNNP